MGPVEKSSPSVTFEWVGATPLSSTGVLITADLMFGESPPRRAPEQFRGVVRTQIGKRFERGDIWVSKPCVKCYSDMMDIADQR
jgi:hypothetical protein